jgi:hypothetical protein
MDAIPNWEIEIDGIPISQILSSQEILSLIKIDQQLALDVFTTEYHSLIFGVYVRTINISRSCISQLTFLSSHHRH